MWQSITRTEENRYQKLLLGARGCGYARGSSAYVISIIIILPHIKRLINQGYAADNAIKLLISLHIKL
jgi:hypothetical protein